MLFFGHIGITAAVLKACDVSLSITKPGSSREPGPRSNSTSAVSRPQLRPYPFLGRIKNRLGRIDYRMVLVGSILPDIIDKPVFLLFGGAALSGRDYAHTLLFNLVLLIGGLVLLRYRRSWLLIISLSSFTHLVLDRMWGCPVTLLWPLLGPLPGGETAGWISDRFYSIFSIPEVYIPEIIGLLILLAFFLRLVKNKGVTGFITSGVVD